MPSVATRLKQIVLPTSVPTESPMVSATAYSWWRTISLLAVIPYAAVLHWAIFHHPTCMLNNFGHRYTLANIAAWLYRDPSLPWAIFAAILTFQLGLRFSLVRALVAPGFAAFAAFSLWIWDIPFTDHLICRIFHDGRFEIAAGVSLRTLHILSFCSLLYVGSLGVIATRFFPVWMGAKKPVLPMDEAPATNGLATGKSTPALIGGFKTRTPDLDTH